MADPGRYGSEIIMRLAAIAIALVLANEAAGLSLQTDGREVRIASRDDDFSPTIVTTLTPDEPFGPFCCGASQANQDSSMTLSQDALVLQGSAQGRGSFASSGGLYHVTSTFRIGFQVHGDATVALSGEIAAAFGLGRVSLRGTETIFEEQVRGSSGGGSPESAPISFSGSLAPGLYLLEAVADGFLNGGGGSFDFGFEVDDSVPESTPALLVSVGIACLGAMARRRPGMGTSRLERRRLIGPDRGNEASIS